MVLLGLKNWKSKNEIYNLINDVDAIIHIGGIVPQSNQNISNKTLLDANIRSTLCICKYAHSMKILYVIFLDQLFMIEM